MPIGGRLNRFGLTRLGPASTGVALEFRLSPDGVIRSRRPFEVSELLRIFGGFPTFSAVAGDNSSNWSLTAGGSTAKLILDGDNVSAILLERGAVWANIGLDAVDDSLTVTRNGGGDGSITLDSSENVGIATDSPQARLHINGTADDQQLIVEGHSTQTKELQEWRNSSAGVVAKVNVDGDAQFKDVEVDGDLSHDGSNAGFFNTVPVAQPVSGADLTNNVTSGGTNDQIDNWTDLTTYATDAAAIRNAVYQLGRKVKQVNDGLRDLGLLT